ncbi:ArsR/SmtB family transcription factor [Bosea sp. PAMC 26642]|uniref:ArsR/SmtB family transcription factor n=1 Tax=Bosea sp. (strain PAMC 26642) TaxID=1792307 RepID=UPI0007703BE6|nr:metalloregulator ArsR/SmtB family transcription factor [Bosea sp. PAMC 26642]AMJ60669.1 ArsR family transcriptional regulator [Bosea sp. PAMC 26642]
MRQLPTLSSGVLLAGLRAAGEETRLRILALLAEGELSVSDLTDILGQSQPRISRHLKLMAEAGLVRRSREGAWAFFRLDETGAGGAFAASLAAWLDRRDPVLTADRERLSAVRASRAEVAQSYFASVARDWDRLRTLHVPDHAVEAAVEAAVGEGTPGGVLDLGTGTGRMLERIAPKFGRAVGVDANHAMLAVARANLEKAGLSRVELRQGDIYALPFARGAFDVVIIHQVLHFLDDPGRAVREAAAMLSPGGRLIVIDFAPHEMEFLRSEHAHRRLGFSRAQIEGWFSEAGLACDLAEEVTLAGGGSGQLPVMLWRGRDRRVQGDLPLRQNNLEVA